MKTASQVLLPLATTDETKLIFIDIYNYTTNEFVNNSLKDFQTMVS